MTDAPTPTDTPPEAAALERFEGAYVSENNPGSIRAADRSHLVTCDSPETAHAVLAAILAARSAKPGATSPSAGETLTQRILDAVDDDGAVHVPDVQVAVANYRALTTPAAGEQQEGAK